MEIKIAFLNPFPVYAQDSAAAIHKKLLILLNGDVKNNLDIKVFSFGDKNKSIISKCYKESIIKNSGFYVIRMSSLRKGGQVFGQVHKVPVLRIQGSLQEEILACKRSIHKLILTYRQKNLASVNFRRIET